MICACILLSCLVAISTCNIPKATIGPAGSTFSLLSSWDDTDIVSFVDLNADRRTDTVVLSSNPPRLQALLEPHVRSYPPSTSDTIPALVELMNLTSGSEQVRSVVTADFNGDSRVDFLLLTSPQPSGPFEAKIYFGLGAVGKISANSSSLGIFKRQPLVCDANEDMLADVFGELENGSRVIAFGDKQNVVSYTYPSVFSEWSASSYAAFASINHNSTPSIIVLAVKNSKAVLELFRPLPPIAGEIPTPSVEYIPLSDKMQKAFEVNRLGQFLFGDFDRSGGIQILTTGCTTVDCKDSSAIFLYSFSKREWHEANVDWTPKGTETDDGSWSLAINSDNGNLSLSALVGTSLGDADLDGFPDLALGLQFIPTNGNTPVVFPVILRNFGKSDAWPASFKAYLLPGVEQRNGLQQIAFFDQDENGILDLFLSFETTDGNMHTFLYVQHLASEGYFLKVMLTNGLCGSVSTCPDSRLPYGLPGYGYKASYSTKGENGEVIRSSSAFVSSSCCGALQLPFAVFGFGGLANYVEEVPVYIPSPSSMVRSHSLTFIVPKSQIVVIPYTHDRPGDWKSKLFLEPLYDMKVIYVAITLVSTCLLLVIIISVFQCLEMREDQKEKMMESQRFHFDAI